MTRQGDEAVVLPTTGELQAETRKVSPDTELVRHSAEKLLPTSTDTSTRIWLQYLIAWAHDRMNRRHEAHTALQYAYDTAVDHSLTHYIIVLGCRLAVHRMRIASPDNADEAETEASKLLADVQNRWGDEPTESYLELHQQAEAAIAKAFTRLRPPATVPSSYEAERLAVEQSLNAD